MFKKLGRMVSHRGKVTNRQSKASDSECFDNVSIKSQTFHNSKNKSFQFNKYVNKQKYFNQTDWNKWLNRVSKFYRTYKFSSKSPSTYKEKISPLFVNKHKDNRPYINVKLLDVNITVLFDSGATVTVVGLYGVNILKDLDLKICQTSSKHISTADGKQQKVLGTVDLPVVVDNACSVINALVVPSLKHSFIFGSDFANKFNILVNFKNQSWRVQSVSQNFSSDNSNHNLNTIGEKLQTLNDLSLGERNRAEKVINSFNEISSNHKLGRTNKIVLNIDTGDAPPFRKRPFPMSPYMSKILNDELDDMLKLGVVEPSKSPWCSPVLLVKKSDGSFRLCYDGRGINALTKPDSYPMPNIDRILSSLRHAQYISSIDLRKAFWQIPLDESSKEKTAFAVVGRGLFQFVTMPFGLRNAAQTQQRLVDAIFGPKYEPHIFTYLDDILVVSEDFDSHVKLLAEVKKKLQEAGLTINLDKCDFFKTSLKFLGYIVGSKSLRTDPEKIECMINYPRPKNTTEVKRFVGLCSWYRRFIKDFSTLMSPINDLLKGRKKGQTIQWTDDAENSFVKIKQLLVSAPILSQPDFSQRFYVASDASNTGLGGVLFQVIDGKERVIAYASRSLSRAERNYSVVERECLAVLFNIEKFRGFVEGVPFTVITDHYSLLWLSTIKNPSGKLARWAIRLRQHTFDLVHRKGVQNVIPDALSRIKEAEENGAEDNFSDPEDIVVGSLDIERIDPWYANLREKILHSPEIYPQWKVENDFVLKFIPNRLPLKVNLPEWRYIVPKPQRKEIIDANHSPPNCGHFGFYKTFSRLQEKYYWPKMRRDILKFVRSCTVCGAQKSTNTAPMGIMGKEKTVNYPFQVIAADLMGPLPRSKKGNKWLLVVTCWFTKYTLLFSLRSSKSKYIEEALENKVFLVHGPPSILICDNGSQFISGTFKNLSKKYNFNIRYNPVYSPQCNYVERYNRTIGTAIRSYIDSQDNWDNHLSEIQQAINTSKHEVTGFTPAFLVYGRHVPLSGEYYKDLNLDVTVDSEILPGNRKDYVENLKGLRDIFVEVRKKIHKAYERSSNMYNLRKRDISFQVGDHVWRKNKVLSSAIDKFAAKLAPKYIHSIVKKKLSNLVYDLINIDGTKAGKWHIKDLKPFNPPGSDDSNSVISE